MKLGVLRQPTRDDRAREVLADDAGPELTVLRELGAVVTDVRATRAGLSKVDAILILEPGDVRRAAALDSFIAGGGPVLAVGGGFAWLCRRGLLDGEVTTERVVQTEPQPVFCVVEGRPTPFTHAIPAGRHVATTLTCGGRRYVHADPEQLEGEGRVVLRYCTADGEVAPGADPAGSVANIAGVCNPAGNLLGILPHVPRSLFAAALAWKVGTPARV